MKQSNNLRTIRVDEEKYMRKSDINELREALVFSLNYFENFKDEIDSLNVFPVPDGDTGTNMYLTLSKAIDEIKGMEPDSINELLEKFAYGALMGARGNSGVILSQLLRGFSEAVDAQNEIGIVEIAEGLENAAKRAYKGVMKPVEGTILTVAKEVGETAISLTRREKNVAKFFYLVVMQAEKSVNNTPELLPVLKEAGVVDAGGKGYEVLLRGIYEYFSSDGVIEVQDSDSAVKVFDAESSFGDDSEELEYKYCTEFLINEVETTVDRLKPNFERYGDSLLVVNGDGFIKVHIHSNHPGIVLEEALKQGILTDIKIDNMEEGQHKNKVIQEDSNEEKELEDRIGVIAIAAGQGIIDIFADLGTDFVVEGGQSMNPSTKDLLEAVKEVNANKIIILPNNKNVISAAEQVMKVTDREVVVLPSRSIPQGLTAMMGFNSAGELDEVKNIMIEEMELVETAQVTYAVRNSTVDGLEIKEGDILGLINDGIQIVTKDKEDVVLQLLDKLIDNDDPLITIYFGKEVSNREAKDLKKRLNEEVGDLDIEFYEGEQPLYYYLISVE